MKDQDLKQILDRLDSLEARILALASVVAEYYGYHTQSPGHSLLRKADAYIRQVEQMRKSHPQERGPIPFSDVPLLADEPELNDSFSDLPFFIPIYTLDHCQRYRRHLDRFKPDILMPSFFRFRPPRILKMRFQYRFRHLPHFLHQYRQPPFQCMILYSPLLILPFSFI
ncbi:MAG: hypothetical protein WC551_12905 [Patescibacteria group bacterium]